MKVRGGNFRFPKRSNVHPKNKIKTFEIYKGDTVQVMQGKDEGKQGKVLEVIEKHDLIVVENVGMVELILYRQLNMLNQIHFIQKEEEFLKKRQFLINLFN